MHNWCLEVWGDYACFTRPEMKVERVSYDVITPSAARGIFEAILWKPAIRWNITKIEVLNPIRWVSVRRNEVGKTIPSPTARQMSGEKGPPLGMFIEDERQQRAGLFLRDVRYRIHAYFDFIPPGERQGNFSTSRDFWADDQEATDYACSNETAGKYAAMFERRAKKDSVSSPLFGLSEFACYFKLVDPSVNLAIPISESRFRVYALRL